MSTILEICNYHLNVMEQVSKRIAELEEKILTESVPDYQRIMWEAQLQTEKKTLAKHKRRANQLSH